MSAHQMLCHLADSYRGVIGEKKISAMTLPVPQFILRWVVLRSPLPWPHNAPTRPEVKQGVGGTRPVEFESDRTQLVEVLNRFCSCSDSQRTPHPVFGNLSREDWMRWGYLHADHHLRQFCR